VAKQDIKEKKNMELTVYHELPRTEDEALPLKLISVATDPRGPQGVCVTSSGRITTYPVRYLVTDFSLQKRTNLDKGKNAADVAAKEALKQSRRASAMKVTADDDDEPVVSRGRRPSTNVEVDNAD
jgi:hypothetical protein